MENNSVQSVDDLSNSLKRFGTADYAVFVFMLGICSVIGLYFGYQDHQKNKNRSKDAEGSAAADYLMGGRSMQVFPVAMSLVASFVSGITLLGTSTEIYLYGTQYAFILVAPGVLGVFMYFFIIPVFHELKMTSIYEYLQARFDFKMRFMGSFISSVSNILYMPIAIYVPALAFNQTTGIDIHVITPIVCLVCIFYTLVGGIKAVVWTDFLQIVIMYGVLVLIMVKGTINAGGLSQVIDRNWDSGRFEAPDFNIDPTIRHSFWTVVVGGSLFWIHISATNQSVIQRYLALKDVKSARKAQIIYCIGITIMIGMCIYNGLLLFATYHDCDPLTTKLAKAKDQMVPLLVLEILKDLPGLSGLFIAGVFSAALSSLSTVLNSMSAVVLEDFFKPFVKKDISERATGFILRFTVLFLGVLSVVLVYVVEKLGSTVLQLSMSVPVTCMGPLFAIFMIGLMLPWFNKKATFYAAIISCIVMCYMVIRSQLDMASGVIKYEIKPMSVEGCTYNFTAPLPTEPPPALEKELHHISYLYFMPFGALSTILLTFVLSLCFGFEDPNEIDPKLLAPFIRKYFKPHVTSETFDTTDGTVHVFEMKEIE